jgi:hypothetical protein
MRWKRCKQWLSTAWQAWEEHHTNSSITDNDTVVVLLSTRFIDRLTAANLTGVQRECNNLSKGEVSSRPPLNVLVVFLPDPGNPGDRPNPTWFQHPVLGAHLLQKGVLNLSNAFMCSGNA